MGYGAIVNRQVNNQGGRFEDFAAAIAQQVVQNNQGMQMTDEPSRIMVDGRRAVLYMMSGPGPYAGQNERVVMVAVERASNDAVTAIFVAPDRDYGRFEPTFKNMLRSLKIR